MKFIKNIIDDVKIKLARRYAKTLEPGMRHERILGSITKVKEFARFATKHEDDLKFLHYYFKHAGENSNDSIINFFLGTISEVENYSSNLEIKKLKDMEKEYFKLRKEGKDTSKIKKDIFALKNVIKQVIDNKK